MIPENRNVAIVGPYFLFAMDESTGVPSIGEVLTISL